jgi:hypothetical protein
MVISLIKWHSLMPCFWRVQWRFENVSKNRDQKVFSDRFEIGTYFW